MDMRRETILNIEIIGTDNVIELTFTLFDRSYIIW